MMERRLAQLAFNAEPVAEVEIYDTVRTRLFESIGLAEEPDYPKEVTAAYQAMYTNHGSEVPPEVCTAGYREDMERAYPFHPALIDSFFKRWGRHPDLQRAPGVLWLLGSILGDLWHRRNDNTVTQYLIQPCHVSWMLDPLRTTLTRLWDDALESVATADVVGIDSTASVFDEERGGEHGLEAIGRGIGAAILLGSFAGKGEACGLSTKDVKVSCSRPGLNWGYLDGALLEMEHRCFYLHTASAGNLGKRYWFGTTPTLNKLVAQYRQRIEADDFEAEIVSSLHARIRSLRGRSATWRVLVDPSTDLPEQKSLALLLLPPALAWGDDKPSQEAVQQRILEVSRCSGDRGRLFRNTLIFLAPIARGVSALRRAYREREALHGVQRVHMESLTKGQQEDLKKRVKDAEKSALEALGPAYVVALRVHKQDVEVTFLPDPCASFDDHLEYLWATLVEDEEWILRRIGGVALQKAGFVPTEGAIRVKDVVNAFLQSTERPLVTSKETIINGLTQACANRLIGIGFGPDVTKLHARYCCKSVHIDPDRDGIWILPSFISSPEEQASSEGKVP